MADPVKEAKGVIGKAEDAIKNAAGKVEAVVENAIRAVEGEAIKLVKMFRDPSIYDAPHTADVHPTEVENMQAGGWITEEQAKDAMAARQAATDAAKQAPQS